VLTVPNIQNLTNASNGYDAQCWDDETDDFALLYALSGQAYVITGMQVTPSSGMTVAVAAGTFVINGTVYTYAGGTVTVGANSGSSGDRRDIISINSSGTLTVTAGTPCGTSGWVRTTNALPPVKPSIPSNNCILGEVFVNYNLTTVAAINIVDKTTIAGGAPGTLLARAFFAPSSVTTYTIVAAATGVTALDTTNLVVTFIAPPSGSVEVEMIGMVEGTTTAGKFVYFAVVSTTSSPGTLVGVVGLVYSTPTTTALDDESTVVMKELITGLTPGNSYTWYFAASTTTASTCKVLAQGGTTNTATPTGAPAAITVRAA
jgi:hypothetical protein